jgi:hypothetical protein
LRLRLWAAFLALVDRLVAAVLRVAVRVVVVVVLSAMVFLSAKEVSSKSLFAWRIPSNTRL